MKVLQYVVLVLLPFISFGQTEAKAKKEIFTKDTLVHVLNNGGKGFESPYLLFIPKGTPKNKPLYLLVEPNNTGKVSDSLEIHMNAAIGLASVSSVGNNISTELKIPLLVPVFPRPKLKEMTYTHALDRDVMLDRSAELKRLDLQLLAMIRDSKEKLKKLGVLTHEKIFMNGFSASATFTNRFLFLHPEIVEAAAIGGFNGELMLPLKRYHNIKVDYPLGMNDFKKISGKSPNLAAFKKVPQFIYMGALDENDAVQFEDAYSMEERNIINSTMGTTVQERFKVCQNIYVREKIAARFTIYKDVGHWTDSHINLDVRRFFNAFTVR